MKRILILVLVFLTVAALLSVGIYQNTEKRYDYGQIPGGVSMQYRESTDSFQMTYFFPPTSHLHMEDYEILYTDKNGIQYWRVYYYITALPWQVRDQSQQVSSGWAHYHADGSLYGAYGDNTVRVVEIYYQNSDLTSVLLWRRGES